jgi:probable F420-dependent oxidoreductase
MKIDARMAPAALADVPEIARTAEALGFDGLWVSETNHDPFLAMALAAAHTSRITIGTAIALAFTRSPTALAYTAWDLAQLSGGRFILGLGTQVKPHITRRFGMPWDPPAPKLREVIAAIRAVWAAWAEGRPLDFRGRFFTLSLMTPFFTPPGPAPTGLRIEVAGVGPRMCRLAGEVADGFHVHPFHTRHYLREVIAPHIEAGLARTDRSRRDFSVTCAVFAATGTGGEIEAARAEIRRHLAFYASTPAYRPVLELHGWEDVGERLRRLAALGRWGDMPGLVSDELLDACMLWGAPDEVAARVRAEYATWVDRVVCYEALEPGRRAGVWRTLVTGVSG